jgi:hypothetical protein
MSMLKKTLYQDPQSHNGVLGGLTVFHVPKAELRNFRLIDFGVATYSSGGRQYAYNVGAMSIVDTITVFDGSVELAQVRGVGYLGAKRQGDDSGAQNYSVGSALYGSQLVYDPAVTISSRDSASPALGGAVSNLVQIDLGKILPFFYGLDLDAYGKMSRAVKGGKRRQVRELIKQANVIPARDMDLRIVIQYTSLLPSQLFVNGVDTDVVTFQRPILVVDEIIGAPRQTDFQIVYDVYDIENVTLPAVAATVTAATPNLRLQGADGSYLKEVTLINAQYPGSTLNPNFKGFSSTAQNEETINLIVNSELLLPVDCDSPARKQMFMNYNSPRAICPILTNLYGHGGTAGLYSGQGTVNLQTMSYISLDIERKISSLFLQYSRRGFVAGAGVESINLIALYTIQKVLQHKMGRSVVVG